MTERFYAKKLLEAIPDEQIKSVVDFLESKFSAEEADDIFCNALLANSKKSKSQRKRISFEEVARECGLNPESL